MFPGFEWCVLKLGVPGQVHNIEVDTIHFKGNFPESIYIEALVRGDDASYDRISVYDGAAGWKPLLPRVKLSAHKQHYFYLEKGDIAALGSITHIRVSLYPDGGISRVRLNGFRTVLSRY